MSLSAGGWVARSLLAVFVVGMAVVISLGIPNGNLRGADFALCFGRPTRLVWAKRRWRCRYPDCPARTWNGGL